MNPGDSKAMEGIQNVERANGGEVEHDSGDEADEPNGGVSLEEVFTRQQNSLYLSHLSRLSQNHFTFDKKTLKRPLNLS